MLWPKLGPLPQTSQLAATVPSPDQLMFSAPYLFLPADQILGWATHNTRAGFRCQYMTTRKEYRMRG